MNAPHLPSHIARLAITHRDHPALRDEHGEVTFGQLGQHIERTALALLDAGLVPGDRIALALEPSVTYVTLILAAMAAGLTPTPLNTRLSGFETTGFLEPLGISLVIADPAHAEFAKRTERSVLRLDNALDSLPLRERLGPLSDAKLGETLPEIDPGGAALILPTGGTSGIPKGVWFDHSALWRSVASSALHLPRRPHDRDLYFAPFFHIMFPSQMLYSLFMGGATDITPRFDPETSLHALAHGVTRLGGAPTLMTRLRQHPEFGRTPRDHVSQVLFGAAPASPGFIQELLDDYPSAQLHSLYGATEYGGPVCSVPHEDFLSGRFDGVGYAWPGQLVEIVDDQGRLLPPDEIGYFRVRSMGQANGYWGRPEAQAETFRADGVYVGDMGTTDGHGRFSIIGRDSEMIITGGENVYPSEVELALCAHPAVAEALVYGMPDLDWGDRVEALVVRRSDAKVDADELRQFARSRLAGYKLPKRIRFVSILPFTPNNKPDRAAAQRLANGLDNSH